MALHKTLSGADLHALPRWTFDNATEMDLVSGLEVGDVGKMAWRTDNDTFFVLSNHSPVTWVTLNSGEITSALLPDMTAASGTVSQIDIGSPTKKFRNLYVHDAHIDASSLYVNEKKVIEDESGTMTVKTDPNEDLKLLTMGTGDLLLISDNEFNVNSKGGAEITVPSDVATKHINISNASPGGNITFYATGTNAQVQFSAAEEIDLTATTIDLNGNVDVSGTFTIGGSALSASSVGLANVPNVDCTNASNITTGTLPSSVLPPIAITSTFTAVNEAAQLALSAQEGDVVVRTDESKSYIHNGGSAGTMADYTLLQTPSDVVLSVNGDTGAVVLTQDDIGNGSTYVRTTNDFTTGLLNKLNGIESNATGDQTASEILTLIKTVDGTGSGLDADSLDGMDSDSAATANTIVARDANGDIYANKVYNAVYNDVADFIPLLDDKIQYGKCYKWTTDGGCTLCTGFAEKGIMGIASDTYGTSVGKNPRDHQVPIGIAGFVLAYVDKEYEPGECLTSAEDGGLTAMTDEDKRNNPERIVATYRGPERNKTYGINHEVAVNGRHWVKVK